MGTQPRGDLDVEEHKELEPLETYSSSISTSRGFNGSVNIPESCDFRSQFLLLNIIFQPSFLNTFLPAYTF